MPITSSPAPLGASERLHALLDAHRLISADLTLPALLDRLVQAARDLVDADSASLAVLGPDGSVERVVTAAPASDVEERDVAGGSNLEVPVRVRGAAFGRLRLAAAEPDHFDDVAEDLVTALAASAGTAVENARLLEEARRSRDWLTASGAVARALLADADEGALLDVVSRALDIAAADYGALILPTDDGRLKVTIARGSGAEDFLDTVFEPADSALGRAILAGATQATRDLVEWAKPGFVNRHRFGPALVAPLADVQGTRGAMLLIRLVGRPPFEPEDVQQASTFAAQIALAMELNETRADAEWLRVVEDRHRIAQDLHDNVMQRLFATGMGLEALAAAVDLDPVNSARLNRHVGDLDQTIEQIRARVFGLRATDAPAPRHRRGRYPHVSVPDAAGEG